MTAARHRARRGLPRPLDVLRRRREHPGGERRRRPANAACGPVPRRPRAAGHRLGARVRAAAVAASPRAGTMPSGSRRRSWTRPGGTLDAPPGRHRHRRGCLVADHQFPGVHGPVHPAEAAAAIERGEMTPAGAIERLCTATASALARWPRGPLLAHCSRAAQARAERGDVPDGCWRTWPGCAAGGGDGRGEREVVLPVGPFPLVPGGRGRAAGGQQRQPPLRTLGLTAMCGRPRARPRVA